MSRDYKTIQEIAGPLMLIRGVEGVAYNELGEIELSDGTTFTPESMGYVADVPYAGYLLVSVNPDIESLTMVRKADVPETGGGSVQEASAPGMGGGRLPAGMSLSEVKLANHSIL